MLTQQQLKSLLHYNQETGVFTWLISPAKGVKVGSIAGGSDGRGYTVIRINKVLYRANRLAFLYVDGKFPDSNMEIDHINNISSDDSFSNLRTATRTQNQWNTGIRKTNKSGFKGVFFNKANNTFRSRITLNHKCIEIGSFKTAELASEAYQRFAKQHHGEFYFERRS